MSNRIRIPARAHASPSRRRALAFTVLASACLTACSVCDVAGDMPEQRRAPSVVVPYPRIEGFHCAAYQVDEREQEDVFGRSLERAGLFAARFEIENATEENITLDLESARVQTDEGEELTPVSPLDVYERLSYSRWRAAWGIPLLIFPVFIYWGQITECNGELRDMLRDVTVPLDPLQAPAGESVRFYLFFALKRGAPLRLVADVYPEGTRPGRDDPVEFSSFFQSDMFEGL